MQHVDRLAKCQCWVDVFDATHFMGRMHRLFGPQNLRRLSAKSMIVGPKACVTLDVRRRGRDSEVTLAPRNVVPDLIARVRGAVIRKAVVDCQMKKLTGIHKSK